MKKKDLHKMSFEDALNELENEIDFFEEKLALLQQI